jgi:hypothetical protein
LFIILVFLTVAIWRDDLACTEACTLDSTGVTGTYLGSGEDTGFGEIWITEQPGISMGTKIINEL